MPVIKTELPTQLEHHIPGLFHTPTKQHPTLILNIPVPQTLERFELVFDITAGPWHSEGQHSLFWLHRGRFNNDQNWGVQWPNNLICYANANGPNSKTIFFNSKFDGKEQRPFRKFELINNTIYTINFVIENDTCHLIVSEKDVPSNNVQLSGGISTPFNTGGWLMLYFGHENATGVGPERPTYGWQYRNLHIRQNTLTNTEPIDPPIDPVDPPIDPINPPTNGDDYENLRIKILRHIKILQKLANQL